MDQSPSESALDARARRLAARTGYRVVKSRRGYRPPDFYGGYMLIDPFINFVVAGSRYDLTAQDVIDWCQPSEASED